MRCIDILVAYETEIGVINDSFDKPSTDDSLFFLNQAVNKFVKLRFNGDLVHRTGFEQTEKRRNDLIKLFNTAIYTNSDMQYKDTQANYDSYYVKYPSDFLYSLNEDVMICDNNDSNVMDTSVFECTRDSFMYRVNNSLTDFHYRFHKARPIRIREADGCQLLTDKNYKIKQYTLGYLRKPNEITLQDPFSEYLDFEDIVMYEIIKIAAQMYLENNKDERYKTITEEVLTQE